MLRWRWGERADTDVDVVALGEEPAVAAGEWARSRRRDPGGGRRRGACGQRGVGHGGFEREAALVRGGGGRRASLVLSRGEAAGLAVGAVGADQDRGAQSFGAVGGGDVELDAVGSFAEGEDAVDLAELDAAAWRAASEGLLEAEVVEALAHGHGADGVAGLDADLCALVEIGSECRWRIAGRSRGRRAR